MQKVVVIDNYDSFTYNLVHYIEGILEADVAVFRNDAFVLADIAQYDKILLSPGPGLPRDAGLLLPLLEAYKAEKDILGICLGLQAIVESYGGRLYNLPMAYHGVATQMLRTSDDDPLWAGIPRRFKAARYHSWVADRADLPACFRITCRDTEDQIMAIAHEQHRVQGIQFHPEAILTEYGLHLLENWLKIKP